VYATQTGGEGFWSLDGRALSMHGAVSRLAVDFYGQWWRLGSAAFLHAGLMHIGFNIYALMIIAPKVEEICGRGRTLLLFMLTAIIGFYSTITFSGAGSVGASGGIMGFLGFAAAWGHKDGTPYGIEVRNMMVQWFVFVTIFGLLMNTDHAAHFGGFISGAIFGWLLKPSNEMKRDEEKRVNLFSYIVFLPIAAISLLQVFFPEMAFRFLSGL
jgi:membrane associated rhomboid family serine protease